MERIIGEYQGEQAGPLLIVFGGIHGNEQAGVKALDLVFKMLEVEPITNPAFSFVGKMIGLRGNLAALRNNRRFNEKDLNRQWTPENVARIQASPPAALRFEDLEMRDIIATVQAEVETCNPDHIYVVDLHTTTADGGIFTIPTNDQDSIELALALHAPVIQGFLKGIQGSTLHFFNSAFLGKPTTAISFESGQHDDPLSVNRAVAALIACLRSIGCVKADDVENRHDNILIEYSENLPRMARLVQIHSIGHGDGFEMLPDYKNFQKVRVGETLANDNNGAIRVNQTGLLLMPLYQSQGDDGFFIIEEVEGF